MPLFNMSANIKEDDSLARKRPHGEFVKQEAVEPRGLDNQIPSLSDDKENDPSSTPMPLANSPIVKCSPGLTESGSSPLEGNSPSPNATPTKAPLKQSTLATFATANSHNTTSNSQPTQSTSRMPPTVPAARPASGEPPAKRKKLSPEEKIAKDAAEAERKKKQEAQKAAKAAENAKAEAEKEKKRKEKEEADKQKAEQKAAEKAAKDAEKAAKDAEKAKKAEERDQKRREKEEEEAKKARSQKKLTSMFKITAPTPKKPTPVVKPEKNQESAPPNTTTEDDKSLYEQTFQPFYVKAHVKLASVCSADQDTCDAKTKILEEWIEGKRGELALGPFNPREACELLRAPIRRGRIYPSVRKIMAEYAGRPPTATELTTESQNTQIRHTREALKSVPIKSLKFKEDVRPPYIGTVSGLPAGVRSLSKIARNPIRKDVLPLNYEYDSEAEWQEDDGEDVDDLDDEEEEADNDEDMDDFLDDSEDVGPARLLFSGGMEPESTGLCWENSKRLNETAKMYKFRMEFILETLDHHSGIDPFSGEYWPSPIKPKATSGADAAKALTNIPDGTALPIGGPKPALVDSKTSTMAPPPVPSDAFQALATKSTDVKKPQQALPADLQAELKTLLVSMPNLSKLGIVEVFASNHAKCPKAQIKASFDALTEKSGKSWKLKA